MTQAAVHVYLISGFLGSGKTTLLNRMLKETPPDVKLMVLMNEFGEEGIDGALVENPELEMIEISRGSIFCACVKGDFIKALYQIAFVIQPDILVMEASGVANPTDIGRDLFNPVFKGNFASLEKYCLIDAAYFLEQYEVFVALEKQIEASNKFIINKVDTTDRETTEKVKEVILSQNPSATFIETTYAQVDLARVFDIPKSRPEAKVTAEVNEEPLLSDEELEEVVDRFLDDAAAQVTPPDRLISMACRWLSGSVAQFRNVAENIPSDVVRAKGFLFESGRPYLYSHVGRSYTIEPFNGRPLDNNFLNRVVFIRSDFKEDDIRHMFEKSGISLLA
ncbi:MAG: GTP-binding protein [Desulfomonilaceae bacterium]|nr:GTP-binding protein [Desulfomonilaceae bacterium]